jgi:hypothetical protein
MKYGTTTKNTSPLIICLIKRWFFETASGQSHLNFGTGSTGCFTASWLPKLYRANALYKPLENLDAIALETA